MSLVLAFREARSSVSLISGRLGKVFPFSALARLWTQVLGNVAIERRYPSADACSPAGRTLLILLTRICFLLLYPSHHRQPGVTVFQWGGIHPSWADLNLCWWSRQFFRRPRSGFPVVSGVFGPFAGTTLRQPLDREVVNEGVPVVVRQLFENTGQSSGAISPSRTKIRPSPRSSSG